MKTATTIIAITLLVIGLLPLAAADNDSLKVVVLVEEKSYSVGTMGKVKVHVFDKGVHVDADSAPEVKLGYYPSRAINVTKTGTGTYEGTFTLEAADLFGGSAAILARATLGKANGSDTSYNEDTGSATVMLAQATPTGLSVSCYLRSAGAGALKPGAAITVEALVKSNGTLVAPSSFKLEATYYDNESRTVKRDLNASASSTGTYRATYNLPDVPYNVDVTFEATAVYQSSDDTSSMTLSVDFFNVICHHVSKTSSSATFDLYIADADGKPVKGAVLALSYPPDSNGSSDRTVEPPPTDAGGKTRVTLLFSDGLKTLHVEGTANASGRSQSFSGTIPIVAQTASVPTPTGDGFEAIFAATGTSYTAGSMVDRDYYVFNDSKVWANKPVYCYVVFNTYSLTPPSLTPVSVEARNLTTDATGKLRLSVRAPSGRDAYIQVNFESATGIHDKPGGYFSDHDSLDGQDYSGDTDYFMAGKEAPGQVLKVTVKELRLGAPSQVEASARSSDPPVAFAAWGAGEVTGLLDPSVNTGAWTIWNEIPSMLSKSGSRYTGTLTIPGFMPKDSKYTVMVVPEGGDMTLSYGLTTLRPGEGTDTGAFPWLTVIIIVIIVVVVILVVVLLKRRKAPVPPSDVVNFAGAPSLQQPPAVPPGGMVPPGQTAGPPPPGAPPVQPQPAAQYPPPPQSPPQYQQQPGQYPPQPGQPRYQPGPQQYAQQPRPPQYPPPPAYVAAPPPSGPMPPPSRRGKVTMPNNAMCGFCNQWLLQGSTGIMCQCGKYFHEHCAKIQEQCTACGTKLEI